MIEYEVPKQTVSYDDYLDWYEATTGFLYRGIPNCRRYISSTGNEWFMTSVQLDTEEDLIAFRLKFGV